MAQRPSQPDDPWERSVMKGLDAFSEPGETRASTAPRPDAPKPAADAPASDPKMMLPREDSSPAPTRPPAQPDPELEAMLSAFEKHADPPSEPGRSPFEYFPLSEEPPPDEVRSVGREEGATPRGQAVMAEISKGLGKASQLASGLGSRTKDYFGSARANFTRPVFKPQAKPRRRKALKIDGREAAVIVLSVVGLAEVGWIGWRVTNPPPPAVVVNPGIKSSSASTVAPAPQPGPAPRTKSAPSAARPKSPATAAPTPATQRTLAPPAAKGSSPEAVKSATAGSRAGGITTASSPGSVNVNALPWASVIIDGAPVGDTPLANLPLSAGPHDVVFKHPELGERRVRVTVTAGTPLRVSTDLRSSAK